MSLQRRLTLFFVVIVILPLGAAGWLVQRLVARELGDDYEARLQPTLEAAVNLYGGAVRAVDDLVRAEIRSPAFASAIANGDKRAVRSLVADRVDDSRHLDFLIAVDRRGRPLAWAATDAKFWGGFRIPGPKEILESRPGAGRGFTRTDLVPLSVRGLGQVGGVVGGFWLDGDLFFEPAMEPTEEIVRLAVAVGGRVVASTVSTPNGERIAIPEQGTFALDFEGGSRAIAAGLDRNVELVAFVSEAPVQAVSREVLVTVVIILLLALILTSLLGYFLAQPMTQPLGELAEGAKAIAEGRFGHHIPVRSRDEIGQLAIAFNHMSDRLRDTVTQLQRSHDQLRRAVLRVGDTLRSTHDMRQMLETILHTARDAVGADAAVMWLLTHTRDELYAMLATGIEGELERVEVGAGVVGLVAERATPAIVPAGNGRPRPARSEPSFPVVLAVPVYRQDRLMGVVACYRSDPSEPFRPDDLEALALLAEQGAVALENVTLHEEARRLSLTDGLTGVWNRRYLQMQFRQVLATAHRFERPFSVLMLDLDNFKDINDTYRHQRGDDILVEFTTRVSRNLREVDTLARYGGDEFVCLLSETDISGALTTARKIVEAIRAAPFGHDDEELLDLTVSVGVACYPDHGSSFTALIEAADGALYKAKQGGRNRVEIADPPAGPGLKVAT